MIGKAQTIELGSLAARLTGLQYFAETAAMIEARDGDLGDAANYLACMFEGMGDGVSINDADRGPVVRQHDLRIVRGLSGDERALVLDCWIELWRGALASQRQIKTLAVEKIPDALLWRPDVLGR